MVDASNSGSIEGSSEPKIGKLEATRSRVSQRHRSSIKALRAETPKASRKSPASVLLTMAAVGGMFTVVALPAYAMSPTQEQAVSLVASVGAQSIEVDASVVSSGAVRDAFTATTPEELAQAKREALAAAAAAARYSSSGSSSAYSANPADDYPWRGQSGMSPLRYYKGECVDFVAWRLNRDQGSTSAPFKWDWGNMTPGGGSARNWTSAWQAKGWPVSSTPIAGAVAVTGYNHVAYVKEVLGDGTVVLEEYNAAVYHGYSQRIMAASSVIAFLYPPS